MMTMAKIVEGKNPPLVGGVEKVDFPCHTTSQIVYEIMNLTFQKNKWMTIAQSAERENLSYV